jgi:hypothetical protein
VRLSVKFLPAQPPEPEGGESRVISLIDAVAGVRIRSLSLGLVGDDTAAAAREALQAAHLSHLPLVDSLVDEDDSPTPVPGASARTTHEDANGPCAVTQERAAAISQRAAVAASQDPYARGVNGGEGSVGGEAGGVPTSHGDRMVSESDGSAAAVPPADSPASSGSAGGGNGGGVGRRGPVAIPGGGRKGGELEGEEASSGESRWGKAIPGSENAKGGGAQDGGEEGDDQTLIDILKRRYVSIYLAFNEVRRWKGKEDVAQALAAETQVKSRICMYVHTYCVLTNPPIPSLPCDHMAKQKKC